jgi:hypothetical protein
VQLVEQAYSPAGPHEQVVMQAAEASGVADALDGGGVRAATGGHVSVSTHPAPCATYAADA